MKTKKPSIPIDRARYKDFVKQAEGFESAAKDEKELKRWNASAVLYVHAAVAWSDAVTILSGGRKATGLSHLNVAALISETFTKDPTGKKTALKNLRLILNQKNAVSYLGEAFSQEDLKEMSKHYEVFSSWCRKQCN